MERFFWNTLFFFCIFWKGCSAKMSKKNKCSTSSLHVAQDLTANPSLAPHCKTFLDLVEETTSYVLRCTTSHLQRAALPLIICIALPPYHSRCTVLPPIIISEESESTCMLLRVDLLSVLHHHLLCCGWFLCVKFLYVDDGGFTADKGFIGGSVSVEGVGARGEFW